MTDPFGGRPCCRVDFELIAGALDFDGEVPPFDQILAFSERIPFTPAERVAWDRIIAKYQRLPTNGDET
jgi:hypothetical protein